MMQFSFESTRRGDELVQDASDEFQISENFHTDDYSHILSYKERCQQKGCENDTSRVSERTEHIKTHTRNNINKGLVKKRTPFEFLDNNTPPGSHSHGNIKTNNFRVKALQNRSKKMIKKLKVKESGDKHQSDVFYSGSAIGMGISYDSTQNIIDCLESVPVVKNIPGRQANASNDHTSSYIETQEIIQPQNETLLKCTASSTRLTKTCEKSPSCSVDTIASFSDKSDPKDKGHCKITQLQKNSGVQCNWDLKEGVLLKQGRWTRAWRKRRSILHSSGMLSYDHGWGKV